jgi:hypothetical protein
MLISLTPYHLRFLLNELVYKARPDHLDHHNVYNVQQWVHTAPKMAISMSA